MWILGSMKLSTLSILEATIWELKLETRIRNAVIRRGQAAELHQLENAKLINLKVGPQSLTAVLFCF